VDKGNVKSLSDMEISQLMIKNIPPEESILAEYVSRVKTKYNQYVDEIVQESDSSNLNIFSWKTANLTIHFLFHSHLYSGEYMPSLTIFTTEYLGQPFQVHDVQKETRGISFKDVFDQQLLSKLFAANVLKFPSDKIIKSSIILPMNYSPTDYAAKYAKREYDNTSSVLVKKGIELVNFDRSLLHVQRFNFGTMLNVINNKQFESELIECLYCYNNGKFYTAAAGLGGVLEHLLYLILEKNKLIDNRFPNNPTHKDYIACMKKEPISIDHRQKVFIDSIFMLRNSVSHYNSGFSSKNICDNMMDGIKNIFDNYYL
jgi:hypothetical protein